MMEPMLLEQLLQGGYLGVFAAFLIWQYIGMQKRLDRLVDRFQEQLKEINDDYDERIEKMRERYNIVIEGIRAEAASQAREWVKTRMHVQETVVAKLESNAAKLDSILNELRSS